MTDRVQTGGLQVAKTLYNFINEQAIPGSGITSDAFWSGLDTLVHELAPKNIALLQKRDELQAKIDAWHLANKGSFDFTAYKAFLTEIGYLQPEGEDFQASTVNVDTEIALQAGPQLVVPITNARFALNAVNARWGSLYDALYGTDALPEDNGADKGPGYNPVRGERVIAFARDFLDQSAPLEGASHKDATGYQIIDGQLSISLKDGKTTSLKKPAQFKGFTGKASQPSGVLLENNGLHLEIQIDPNHHIGQVDAAGVKDVLLEAALTTIMDCEDSVAAVDAEDKTLAYSNWLGLMKGDLEEPVSKGGKTFTRKMNADRNYTNPQGETFTLPGRSLMFVRNVGHLMTNPAILLKDGSEIPEGIMDCAITALIAKQDLLGKNKLTNSRTGSMYIVKPKMHGPEEVEFSDQLFGKVEDLLGLERFTLKMGIMD